MEVVLFAFFHGRHLAEVKRRQGLRMPNNVNGSSDRLLFITFVVLTRTRGIATVLLLALWC